jgi:2,4-dienoyl-CoA reductase-like NADH-dependent reductase (Old Yellow Enzyme family)
MINVSTRYFHNPEWPQHDERSLAGWVKSIAKKPVATVGSVGLDVDLMQTLYSDKQEQQTLQTSLTELVSRFSDGEFDLVAVGRSIIGDPAFVNKVRDGRFDEIRPFTRADLSDVLHGLDGDDVPEEILRLAQATADAG